MAKPKRGIEMTEQIIVRLTREEKAALLLAAERLDMTLSDFVRVLCLPYARDVSSGVPVEQFTQDAAETAAGTADYFAARYKASMFSPSILSDAMKVKAVSEDKKPQG